MLDRTEIHSYTIISAPVYMFVISIRSQNAQVPLQPTLEPFLEILSQLAVAQPGRSIIEAVGYLSRSCWYCG